MREERDSAGAKSDVVFTRAGIYHRLALRRKRDKLRKGEEEHGQD